jgi:predicted O-methyltransferase YrrM
MNPYYEHFLNSTGGRDIIYQGVLEKFKEPTKILEIGVARDLGLYARDSDGWSSLHFARHVAQYGGELTLVDIDEYSIDNCEKLTEGFKSLTYVVSDGLSYLKDISKNYYDIINLDAGDDPSLTFEMYNITKSLNPKAIIIDDFHTKGALIPKGELNVHRWDNGHEVAWVVNK